MIDVERLEEVSKALCKELEATTQDLASSFEESIGRMQAAVAESIQNYEASISKATARPLEPECPNSTAQGDGSTTPWEDDQPSNTVTETHRGIVSEWGP